MSSIDISSLNRWQRMRVVALAIGCGMDIDELRQPDAPTANKNDESSNSNENNNTRETIIIPFAAPARSLVDKHFDALAQTMAEIGVEWAVETNPQKDLVLTFFFSPETKSNSDCGFLHSLAKICNSSSSSQHDDDQTAWWWNEKYSPDYINMETGDIGPSDPQDDFLVKPLRSWGENCRYVLHTISQRLANIVVSKEKTAQRRLEEEFEDEEEQSSAVSKPSEEELAQRMQVAVAKSETLKKLSEKFASDKIVINISLTDLQKQDVTVSFDVRNEENESVFTSGGFNRTRVKIASGEENSSYFVQHVMKSPASYSFYLFKIISKITSAFAEEVLRCCAKIDNDDDDQQNTTTTAATAETSENIKHSLIAALTAATFSDARRRQFSSSSSAAVAPHQNPMMMPSMMMMNQNSGAFQVPSSAHQSSSSPAGVDVAPGLLPPMMMAMLNAVNNNNNTNNNQQEVHTNPNVMPIPSLPSSTSSSSASAQADNFLAMVMAGRKTVTSQNNDNNTNVESPSKSSQPQPQQVEDEKTKSEDPTSVEAILARIEQQKQIMMMSQKSDGSNSAASAPPPPLHLPLSYFEEMLILGESIKNDNHHHAQSFAAFHQLRYRVELEDHEEEELTNYLFEKPTYVGEFGNVLIRSIQI